MRWVVCGLWRLWKCRNSLVFQNKIVELIDVVRMLQQQWKELEDILRTDGSRIVGVRRCERVEMELPSTWASFSQD